MNELLKIIREDKLNKFKYDLTVVGYGHIGDGNLHINIVGHTNS